LPKLIDPFLRFTGNPLYMKKEKLSFWVLIVEIAAIVYLHSAKNRQTPGVVAQSKTLHPPTYQLNVMPIKK
jgi:hypothetical protein